MVGALCGIPFIIASTPIIEKLGHINTIILGFAFYVIRMFGEWSILSISTEILIFKSSLVMDSNRLKYRNFKHQMKKSLSLFQDILSLLIPGGVCPLKCWNASQSLWCRLHLPHMSEIYLLLRRWHPFKDFKGEFNMELVSCIQGYILIFFTDLNQNQ